MLLYRSGLRVSEVLALRHADINLTAHTVRVLHTFAWELDAGTPVTVISTLLSHSSVAVTARHLAHLTNRQAVTALAAADLPEVGL
jgi:integrase